ncbi:hypothetical protein MAHJHV59_47510 [Mycobacterium avium subsp. hominissuis]
MVTSSYGRGRVDGQPMGDAALPQRVPRRQETPADSSTSTDCYGNICSYFHVTEPHHSLTVTSDSIVDVNPPARWCTGPAPAG